MTTKTATSTITMLGLKISMVTGIATAVAVAHAKKIPQADESLKTLQQFFASN